MSAMKEVTLLTRDLKIHIDEAVASISREYISQGNFSNEEADNHAILGKDVARLACYQKAKSWAEKGMDEAKKAVASQLTEMAMECDVDDGSEEVLCSNNLFEYSMKRNNTSTSSPIKDFITELRALGVTKDVVDKALKASEKTKRGSAYHNIEVL